jgi:hypothetical protein
VSWRWRFDDPAAAGAAWRASVDGLRLPRVDQGQPAHTTPPSFRCRTQPDGGVVGARLDGRNVTLASLVEHDAETTCSTLATWLRRLNPP